MLESKDRRTRILAELLDLTVVGPRQIGSECQIRSTSDAARVHQGGALRSVVDSGEYPYAIGCREERLKVFDRSGPLVLEPVSRSPSRGSGGRPSVLAHARGVRSASNRLGRNMMVNHLSARRPFVRCRLQPLSEVPPFGTWRTEQAATATTGASVYYTELT